MTKLELIQENEELNEKIKQRDLDLDRMYLDLDRMYRDIKILNSKIDLIATKINESNKPKRETQ